MDASLDLAETERPREKHITLEASMLTQCLERSFSTQAEMGKLNLINNGPGMTPAILHAWYAPQ